jgi:RHS repeat-associated protein
MSIAGGEPVTFHYDAEGGRRARVINEGIPGEERITRYFSDLVHTTDDGVTTRRYFMGGTLIASRAIDDDSWQMAAGPSLGEAGSGVEIAAASWSGRPVLVVGLSAGAQGAVAAVAAVLLAAALIAPGRKRRVIGLRLRHGHVVIVVVLFVCGSTPWPLLLRPAQAQPPPSETVHHYHTDHLGSVQVITDDDGLIVEEIRYYPYGEIRGRFGPGGNVLPAPSGDSVRHEFTGHETELNSGLIYAGARFLDPLTATFQTHDPAAQYLNPYAYGPWDPMNGSDPTGAFFGVGEIVGFLAANLWWIAPVAGAVASFGQALANGASFGQAIGAAAIGAGIGLVTGGILGGIGEAITNEALKNVYVGALIASGAGTTAHGAAEGQYITAGVGAALLALGLVAAFSQGGNGAGGGQSRGLSNVEIDEYGSLFSGRDVPSDFWQNIRLDNSSGLGGRPYTWRWPWSKEVTIHMGGEYSAGPLVGRSEAAATLAHELGHALDFRQSWFGTAVGALKDQTLYAFGVNVYNPSLNSAGSLSGFSVEGRATLYEWSYRTYYGIPGRGSNYPTAPADVQRLYGILYP